MRNLITHHPVSLSRAKRIVKDRPRGFQLVAVDRVTHSRIETNVNRGSETVQCRGRLLDPFLWNMRINVTAPDKYWRAIEGAGKVERGSRWTDQAAAEPYYPGVPLRIARRGLQGQTGALGKAQ